MRKFATDLLSTLVRLRDMKQNIIISQNLQQELAIAISECEHEKIFVLLDQNTERLCWPKIASFLCLRGAKTITIPAGDTHKDLTSISHVWNELGTNGATRHSLLINLGGGMVTDLGGFAASTFKRGINFINVPTTLLAMVDASVGGKTGINFNGLKNEIGVFCDAHTVILSTLFLETLDRENILSGFAEMLKHSLIADEAMWAGHVTLSLTENASQDSRLAAQLKDLVRQSVQVKEHIVTEDPKETGLRKALNLGHTVGHAFESFAMLQQEPMLHGYAVAYGLICELWLSAVKCGFPTDKLHQTVSFIRENYGQMDINCDDYPTLIELMRHDKKNNAGVINFTLLGNIGDIRINQQVSDEDIRECLDFYREGTN